MKTRLLFLRHGQSIANVEKFFSGQTDVPLTDLGHTQAELAAKSLSGTHFDAIFSSPLERAYSTALHFSKNRGIDITVVDNLTEWCAGSWEGLSFDKIKLLYPKEHYLWTNDPINLVMPNGESARDVRLRVGKAVDTLADTVLGKTVLIVCHGGVIKTLPSYFAGCDDRLFNETPVPTNCSITEIHYCDGNASVVRYSDDSHLENFKGDAFEI